MAEKNEVAAGYVMAKVTKLGAGKIATGSPGEGVTLNSFHERGDTIALPLDAAAALEEKGWVETD